MSKDTQGKIGITLYCNYEGHDNMASFSLFVVTTKQTELNESKLRNRDTLVPTSSQWEVRARVGVLYVCVRWMEVYEFFCVLHLDSNKNLDNKEIAENSYYTNANILPRRLPVECQTLVTQETKLCQLRHAHLLLSRSFHAVPIWKSLRWKYLMSC